MSNLNVNSDSVSTSRKKLIEALESEAMPISLIMLEIDKVAISMAFSPVVEKAIMSYLSNKRRELENG